MFCYFYANILIQSFSLLPWSLSSKEPLRGLKLSLAFFLGWLCFGFILQDSDIVLSLGKFLPTVKQPDVHTHF